MTRALPAQPLTPAAAHRAAQARVKCALLDAVDAHATDDSARALVASQMDTTAASLDQMRWPSGAKHVSAARLASAPTAVLVPVLRAMAEGHPVAIAVLPESDASQRASFVDLADAMRETAEALTAHTRAIADGVVTRGEGAETRREIDEAIVALLRLRALHETAEREGVASVDHGTVTPLRAVR